MNRKGKEMRTNNATNCENKNRETMKKYFQLFISTRKQTGCRTIFIKYISSFFSLNWP